MGYDVFVSYSHGDTGRLAEALQDALQRFSRPWYARRPFISVFRDETSFGAGHELGDTLTAAVEEAEHLLVLLSPRAAASPWVDQEIRHFVATRGKERVVFVVGGWAADDDAGQLLPLAGFDWDGPEVPPTVREAFDEPLAVDMRWAASAPDEQLTLDDERFRDDVATIAAAVKGQRKDELVGAVVAMRTRARILTGSVVMGALILLGAIAIAVPGWLTARAAEQDAKADLALVNEQVDQATADLADARDERDDALGDRDRARDEQAAAEDERDAAQGQRDVAVDERDAALGERDTAQGERDAAVGQRDAALGERDAAFGERDTARGQRDAALGERDDAVAQRDTAVGERDVAFGERDTAVGERDTAVGERDAAQRERDEALDERDTARTETLARGLTAQARQLLDTRLDLALLLALAGNDLVTDPARTDDDVAQAAATSGDLEVAALPDAMGALLDGLTHRPHLERLLSPRPGGGAAGTIDVAASPDGRWVAFVDRDGTVLYEATADGSLVDARTTSVRGDRADVRDDGLVALTSLGELVLARPTPVPGELGHTTHRDLDGWPADVRGLALSPSGERLAVVSEEPSSPAGTAAVVVQVWDVQDVEAPRFLDRLVAAPVCATADDAPAGVGPCESVRQLAWDERGTLLAWAGGDHDPQGPPREKIAVAAVDPATGRFLGAPKEVPSTGRDGFVVVDLAFAPTCDADGRCRLAAGLNDESVRTWTVRGGAELEAEPAGCAIAAVDRSHPAGCDAGPPSAGRQLARVAFSPGGERLVAGDLAGRVHAWDVEADGSLGPRSHVLDGHNGAIRGLAFAGRGSSRVVSTSHVVGEPAHAWNLDVPYATLRETDPDLVADALQVVAVGPGADVVAVGGRDGTVRLLRGDELEPCVGWDPCIPGDGVLLEPGPAAKCQASHPRAIASLAAAATRAGPLLVAGTGLEPACGIGEVRYWLGETVGVLELPDAATWVGAVAIDAACATGWPCRVAAGMQPADTARASAQVVVWEIDEDGTVRRDAVLRSPGLHMPQGVGFLHHDVPGAPDVVAVGFDARLHAWDDDGSLVPVGGTSVADNRITSLAVHPTRPWLAVGSFDQSVRILDVSGVGVVGVSELDALGGPGARVSGVAWDATGSVLVATSDDDDVHVWHVDAAGEGTPVGDPLDLHDADALGVATSADALFSVGLDRRLVRAPLGLGPLRRHACDLVARDLDEAERSRFGVPASVVACPT